MRRGRYEAASLRQEVAQLRSDLMAAEKYISANDTDKEEAATARARAKIEALSGEKERLLAELSAARASAIQAAATRRDPHRSTAAAAVPAAARRPGA